MDTVIIDDQMTDVQQSLIQQIDQISSKILSEFTQKICRTTQKLKNLVITKITEILSDRNSEEQKEALLDDIRERVDASIKQLKLQFQYGGKNNSQLDMSMVSNKSFLLPEKKPPPRPSLAQIVVTNQKRSQNGQFNLNEAELTCQLCSRVFRNLVGLGRHMKMAHQSNIVNTFKCIHCNILVKCALTLAYHLFNRHGDMGHYGGARRRFYVEEKTQQIFYFADDLKAFIQKSDIFSGFQGNQVDDIMLMDVDDAPIIVKI